MEELVKKIQELRDLIKAVAPKQQNAHKVPSIPKISPPAQPSMVAVSAPTKIPGMNPDSKKDPKKIAEQIKSGAIRKPNLIKGRANGQWELDEPVEKGIKTAIAGAALAGAALMSPGKASAAPIKAPTATNYETLDHGNGQLSTLNDRTYGPYTVTTKLEPTANSRDLIHRVTLTGKDHSPDHAKALANELKGSGIDHKQIMGLKAGDDLMSGGGYQKNTIK